MVKNKIFNYFYLEFLKVFLLITLSLSILIWITQAARLLDLVTEFGNPILTYIKYLLYIYPKILDNVFIFCFCISMFFLFAKFENSKEINIYWMSGVSKITIVGIVLKLSLALLSIYLVISAIIAPASLFEGRKLLGKSKFSLINSLVKEQNFNSPLQGLTVYVNSNDKKGNLKGVFIYEKSRTIFANYGQVLEVNNDYILKLYDGITHEKSDRNINTIKFNETFFDLSNYELQNITHPKFNERSLTWLIENIKNSKIKKKNELREEINKRIINPFFIFIIGSLSCFLLYNNEEKINLKKLKLIIYIISIFLLIINQFLLSKSGESNTYSVIYFIFLLLLFVFILLILNKILKSETL